MEPNVRRLSMPRIVPAVVVALLLTACGGGNPTSGPSSTPPTSRPSSPATVKILSPPNGATVKGPIVHVRVLLTGAKIVPATTTHITPTQGHLHVYLDGKIVSMNFSTNATIPDVSPGQHLLKVEFVASDHLPFDPRVITGAVFVVKG
jgi:hypothetical protein